MNLDTNFKHVHPSEYYKISWNFSAVAGKSGVEPTNVWVSDDLCLMEYHELDSNCRIGLTRLDNEELQCSWSFVSDILLEKFPGTTFIEVYPTKDEIVNTGHSRWFWEFKRVLLQDASLFKLRERLKNQNRR